MIDARYKIVGMTCTQCAVGIEDLAHSMTGVTKANINFNLGIGEFSFEDESAQHELSKRIQQAGYYLHPFDSIQESSEGSLKLWVLGICAFILIILAMGPLAEWPSELTNNFLQAIFASIPVIIESRKYLHAILNFGRTGVGTMNTLVGLGAFGAYTHGIIQLITSQLSPGHQHMVHFEALGVLIYFVALGKHLEETSRTKAMSSWKDLLALSIPSARLWNEGKEEMVELSKLSSDAVIMVKAGERIPVDGKIIEGSCSIDESILTGESMPLQKTVGHKVLGGSLNLDGRLLIKTLNGGEQSFIQQIQSRLLGLESEKSPMQRTADKLGRIFVPIVLVLSLLALFIHPILWGHSWQMGFSHMLAVLVVACPCALGLATPLVISLTSERALRMGILLDQASTLENVGRITQIFFDKTGTLTEGRPEVETITWHQKHPKAASWLVGMCQYSEHPLAKALVTYGNTYNIVAELNFSSFEVIAGKGMKATIDGQDIFFGRVQHLSSSSTSTESHLLINQKHIATVSFEDHLREAAPQVIKDLQNLGLKVGLLSGDRPEVVEKVARKLGLNLFMSGLSPQEKEAILRAENKSNVPTLMVGDGLNDSLALQESFLSMAMGQGTDLAKSVANLTLLNDKIENIPRFIRLAKKSHNLMMQNFAWAFGYNLIMLPMAMGLGGLNIGMGQAGLLMALSSLTVVMNSLRVKLHA